MGHNIQLLFIIGGALVGATFILLLLSNALSTWSEREDDYGETTFGLWRYCYSVEDGKICESLTCPSQNFKTDFCNKIVSARTFLTLACILSGIFTTISIIFCAVTGDITPRLLLLTSKGLAFASLIMAILGVALGINATITAQSDIKFHLGDAAIIGIAAIAVNLFGAIATVLVKE